MGYEHFLLNSADFSNNIMKKHLSEEDYKHVNNCDGCCTCDYIMEHYSHCYCCDVITSFKHLYYDVPTGDYYCEDCVGAMPYSNTNEFVRCGKCIKRDVRKNMHMYHENFQNTWTCNKCVSQSIVNSRFELLDF